MAKPNPIASIVATAREMREPKINAAAAAIAAAKKAHCQAYDRLNGNGDTVAARSAD